MLIYSEGHEWDMVDDMGQPDGMSEEEMMGLLLKDFEEFQDEGRDEYFKEVVKKMRKDLKGDEE